ncbi:MAG: signal peptidase II [Thermodesulfobacteriota bacterium]
MMPVLFTGATALLVVVLDQLSKWWIIERFALYESVEVIPGLFSLTHLLNRGVAFGMFADGTSELQPFVLAAVAMLALAALAMAYRSHGRESFLTRLAIALIGGGAVGNLIDRIRLGAVVDFLDFYIGEHHWPAFNVADSAITVGVGLFLLATILQERAEKAAGKGGR